MSILINKDTKVITQGITGKTGQFHTLGCQAYANGKNCFVAGVNPKKAGEKFSDIPIYAFTRHEATRRRVMLYRGVAPVDFDVAPGDPLPLHERVFAMSLELGLVDEGDLVILTKGELTGVQGGTNSMQIVQVHRS